MAEEVSGTAGEATRGQRGGRNGDAERREAPQAEMPGGRPDVKSDPDLLEEEEVNAIEPEDLKGIRGALTRYRVMAWVVGTLLVLLTLVAMPLKYIWDYGGMVTVVGVAHGWLYAVLLITVVDLGFRVKWHWGWYLAIAAAGTVPFLSFYAEHRATKYVRGRIADVEAGAGQA